MCYSVFFSQLHTIANLIVGYRSSEEGEEKKLVTRDEKFKKFDAVVFASTGA